MADLRRRLLRLERAAASLRRAQPEAARLRIAAAALFDVLEAHFPADPWSAGLPRHSSADKVAAAAARLLADAPSDVDLAALAAMPQEALRIFGTSAKELLITVGTLDQWARENGIGPNEIAATSRV